MDEDLGERSDVAVERLLEQAKAAILKSLEGPRFPVGTVARVPEACFDAKMAHLQHCFSKYGHKFARKKRQMKKNRKRYGMCWKINRIYKMVVDKGRDEGSQWAFIGSSGELLSIEAHCPETIPISHVVRI